MEKTIDKIVNGAKKGLVVGGLLYGFVTLGTFSGTSYGIRKADAEYNRTIKQRMILNDENITDYNQRSLCNKILNWGEYLAYKVYQKNVGGFVEGVNKK